MMETLRETYRNEARELLGDLEQSLLALENGPDDAETIGRVFRALHTIKGSGGMAGFDTLAAFTHEIETTFERVRSGRIGVTRRLIDLTLASVDRIRAMVEDEAAEDDPIESAARSGLLVDFRAMFPEEEDGPASCSGPLAAVSAAPLANPSSVATYRVRFRPGSHLFATGTNPLGLLEELRQLGECRIIAHTDQVPPLESLDPELCLTHWDVILSTDRSPDVIRDVFLFVDEDCEIVLDLIDGPGFERDEESYKRVGEILVERGFVRREDVERVTEGRQRLGDLLVESGLVQASQVEAALAEQQQVREVRRRSRREEQVSSIRVPAAKLDALVNLVGELVTVQARLGQIAAMQGAGAELLAIAEEVARLTDELRSTTMNIRMLPIGTLFGTFARVVRDLAQELGKDVELVTEGAETELDKTVIERLHDPLVHLIRNSVDHGIEDPGKRREAGKPGQGTIRLAAEHSGAHVLIRIEDDGRGLDRERIRATAIERGLIGREDALTENDLFGLVFSPGFSTAARVTSVSGRGVGMDVVKTNIDAMRGSIEIVSEPGAGTAITVRLPLTLAIIDGLLVSIGDAFFVLPLSIVEECVELSREEAIARKRRLLPLRGRLIPYLRLREHFGIDGAAPPIEQVVITGNGHGRIGFAVDKVIGEHQTVIKSLGKMYRGVRGISGATLLGDGTVALILDTAQLMNGMEAGLDEGPEVPG